MQQEYCFSVSKKGISQKFNIGKIIVSQSLINLDTLNKEARVHWTKPAVLAAAVASSQREGITQRKTMGRFPMDKSEIRKEA